MRAPAQQPGRGLVPPDSAGQPLPPSGEPRPWRSSVRVSAVLQSPPKPRLRLAAALRAVCGLRSCGGRAAFPAARLLSGAGGAARILSWSRGAAFGGAGGSAGAGLGVWVLCAFLALFCVRFPVFFPAPVCSFRVCFYCLFPSSFSPACPWGCSSPGGLCRARFGLGAVAGPHGFQRHLLVPNVGMQPLRI